MIGKSIYSVVIGTMVHTSLSVIEPMPSLNPRFVQTRAESIQLQLPYNNGAMLKANQCTGRGIVCTRDKSEMPTKFLGSVSSSNRT